MTFVLQLLFGLAGLLAVAHTLDQLINEARDDR